MNKVVNEQEHIDWVDFSDLRSDLKLTGPAIGTRANSQRIRRKAFRFKV